MESLVYEIWVRRPGENEWWCWGAGYENVPPADARWNLNRLRASHPAWHCEIRWPRRPEPVE